jgi:hypothetical protein
MVAFAALAVSITTGLYGGLRKKLSAANLAAGALLWWVILAAVVCVYVPGGSYAFTWPPLFSLVGFGSFLTVSDEQRVSLSRWVVLVASAMPAVLVVTPLIYLLFITVGISKLSGVVVTVVLLLGLLVPHFEVMAQTHRWLVPATLAVVAAGFLVAGILTAGAVPSAFAR